MILILDFGGQYSQLIARRIRECNVYCEVLSHTTSLEELKKKHPKGIIFTGGPNSVYDEYSPRYEKGIFELGIPILGICYGSQFMVWSLGGTVETAPVSEYGYTEVKIDTEDALFEGVSETTVCWMSHTDYIASVPEGFQITAYTPVCPIAAMSCAERNLYAVQFHPEAFHTKEGIKMLQNFVYKVCQCEPNWKMDSFVTTTMQLLKEKIGKGKVLCALSGGVDSAVAAVLLSKIIGKQLTCIFVDHGLLRKNEGDEIEEIFGKSEEEEIEEIFEKSEEDEVEKLLEKNEGNELKDIFLKKSPYELNFIRVNAQQRFYERLKGVTEPEQKRKVIGEEFIRIFEEEAKKIGAVDFFVQGTIYSDVIESGHGTSAVIKSHHNVGGLPSVVDFKEVIEPFRRLFKDEVRQVGLELGMPEQLVSRQPFPGPGLGVRIVGEVTEEKVKIVQDADFIFREEITKAGLEKDMGQYFAGLTNMRSVGVMGDFRTYDYAVVLRAVKTEDFMTAECAEIPYEVLFKVTNRIVNEVKGVNRVFYDLTSKPPGTIEWE